MTFKCELEKEKDCDILNKELGNCEIEEDGVIAWRCIHYKKLKEIEKKSIYDYKIGEINNEDMMNGIMKAPNKLVKIGYTFQDKNQTQMEVSLKHKDFIEDEDY